MNTKRADADKIAYDYVNLSSMVIAPTTRILAHEYLRLRRDHKRLTAILRNNTKRWRKGSHYG